MYPEKIATPDKKIIWIDPTGISIGNGSKVAPYNSWDLVKFEDNTEYRQLALTTFNGIISTTRSNINISTYGGPGKALVNGNGQARCIEIGGGAYNVHIDGFEVFGANNRTLNNVRGITIGNNSTNKANNCSITNCIVRDISYSLPTDDANGIQVFGDDFVLLGTIVHSIATDGIWLYGDRPIIGKKTHVYNIAQDARVVGDCLQFSTGGVNDYHVYDTILDHSNTEMKNAFIDGGSGVGGTKGGIIEDCTLIMGTDGAAVDSKTLNIMNESAIARNNTITNGEFGIFGRSGKYIGNTLEGQTIRGINAGFSESTEIKNNIIKNVVDAITISNSIARSDVIGNTIIDCTNGITCYKPSALLNGLTVERNDVIRATNLAYQGFTASASNT